MPPRLGNSDLRIVAIDNGVTGSVSIAAVSGPLKSLSFKLKDFFATPTKLWPPVPKVLLTETRQADDSKPRRGIDVDALRARVDAVCGPAFRVLAIEPPMCNPKRWKASMSAAASDAQLMDFAQSVANGAVVYVPAIVWQSGLGIEKTGAKSAKDVGLQLACKLFPSFAEKFTLHGDADSALLAWWVASVLDRVVPTAVLNEILAGGR